MGFQMILSNAFTTMIYLTWHPLICWVGGILACQQKKPGAKNDELWTRWHHLQDN